MNHDTQAPGQTIEALWDEQLLTQTRGELGWDRMNALAEALAAEPGGWRRAAGVYEACLGKPYGEQDAAWLRVPILLAAVGQRLDGPGRRELAEYLIAWMSAPANDSDFALEALLAVIGSLGPAALGPLSAALASSHPDRHEWFTLLGLLDLGADPSASEAQRAVAIEACEALLRRAVAGEIEACYCESAGWALALMGHTPSIGLVEQAARAWQRDRRGHDIGCNEFLESLAILKGEQPIDPALREVWWSGGPDAWAPRHWEQFQHWQREMEQEEQADFEADFSALTEPDFDDPGDEDDPAANTGPLPPRHTVGRNDPCPCGSGKKYKKCCLP